MVLPSLLTSDTSAAVTVAAVAAVALALAALVRPGPQRVLVTARTSGAGPVLRAEAAPVRPGRATDPQRHPLRPRAPGRA
ncbi:hypothetical protein EKO23_03985 [Nocardioides guangzhouensis]|uniref:Uncharacterized protein n=1 Tax=Nocardioides guangzhouensis TaxID=2497878 RepID=A0A4Q4ZJ91_9ACTN|nr:hypothetical protein EKO23_03985 [Nocardioides guangzhouensis]